MRAWVGLVVAVGCSRASALPGDGGAGVEAAAALPVASEPTAPPIPPDVPSSVATPVESAPAGEARRATLPSLERDPLLRAQLATLRDHFGADARGPFAVQSVERAGGGSALLVTRSDESDPIVLVVDRDRLVFAKQRPTAGITPPAQHVTLAPGPERGVAVFAWVEALHLVAARMWADDANPFAESVVMKADACDAMTVAYAPGMGWIVACASNDGTRAQRLREDLTSAWGSDGVTVGTVGPVGRASIAFDTPTSWTLQQRAKGVRGDRAQTFRYDGAAQPLSALKNPSP